MPLEVGCEDASVRLTDRFDGVWCFMNLRCYSIINTDMPIGGVHVARMHRLDELICNEPKVDSCYGF